MNILIWQYSKYRSHSW